MTQEIQELLHEIVALASEITHGDSCLIYLFDKEKKTLVLRASKNPHPHLLQKISLKMGEGITGWVAKTKTSRAIPSDAYKHPHFKLFPKLPEDKFEAFLSVPILDRNGLVGVINIQHQHIHHHSVTEVNVLTALGKLVGAAVENALLLEETSELKAMLVTRKLLDRAKGIVMHRHRVSEPQAYELIKRQSMNSRKSLKDIAAAIILSENLTKSSSRL